jgi:hypothetical protein
MNCEESGRGLFKILPRYLPKDTEVNHEEPFRIAFLELGNIQYESGP